MTKRTEKFNVAVKIGGVLQPAGTPIPIGGKDGMDEDEVKRLRDNFGTWRGGPEANGPEAGDDALSATIASLESERDQLSGEVDRLKAENERLANDLAKAKLAPAGRGSADVDGVKKALAAAETENKTLSEDNATLSAEVTRLTAELEKQKGGQP